MSPLVEQNLEELREFCMRFSVKRLDVSGSAARKADPLPETSDLDFLVEFLPLHEGGHADTYFGLLFALEDLFSRPVDLVMAGAIRNPYFRESVERSRKLLYAA